jgi:hypothetical protein
MPPGRSPRRWPLVFRHSGVPDDPKRATFRRGAETTGGAGSGREEALEVAYPDRQEATREAEATEEDLARQVTTGALASFLVSLGRERLANRPVERSPPLGATDSALPATIPVAVCECHEAGASPR